MFGCTERRLLEFGKVVRRDPGVFIHKLRYETQGNNPGDVQVERGNAKPREEEKHVAAMPLKRFR